MKKINWAFYLAAMSYCNGAIALPSTVDIDGPKTITADKIEYNAKSAEIKTVGNTTITNQSGQTLKLTNSDVSNRGANIAGSDIELWLGDHVYITAEKISRDGDITIADDAMFTACDGCDSYGNAWEIFATTIKHDKQERNLYFHNPVLWMYDLPVFWFPYYYMPDPGVKYRSGLLMPDFNSTNNMGTQINLPVYISLSEYHDATVTMSYLTKENPLVQIEHRLNADHSKFRTTGSYTHNKEGKNRWHIFNNDIIELGEYARAEISLERVSDQTYLQKYGFYNDQPYLDSGAQIELFGQSGYVVADTHFFQELRTAGRTESSMDGNILPNVRGVYQTAPIYRETYILLNSDILGVNGHNNTGMQRVIGDARIVSPWTLWGGNRLTLSMDARYDVYNFQNYDLNQNPDFTGVQNRFLPSGYVEWGLPLFRPGKNWTHILEPRARLTFMRHTKTQEVFAVNNDSAGALLSDVTLFSNNRFSGYDLWENGTFADYGLRWATYGTDAESAEIFFGQSYDLSGRSDTDPNSGFHKGASDWVGRIGLNNGSWLGLNSRFRFDRDTFSLRHIETDANIGTSRNYVYIGHIWSEQLDEAFLGQDINETTSGVKIQLTERLSLNFNAVYNNTYNRFQRHYGMLFYQHPCYFLSLGYRTDNAIRQEYAGNTTFQFRFGLNY
ncbi:MAG: LPS-assembly protein LptD [Alphaproteobacteria bacterium]|nr:LPS-assembly protein LptD [Alphaproteobacteria bacterium]